MVGGHRRFGTSIPVCGCFGIAFALAVLEAKG